MDGLLPRVAYFAGSFHEVNGVAHTSCHHEAFARRADWFPRMSPPRSFEFTGKRIEVMAMAIAPGFCV